MGGLIAAVCSPTRAALLTGRNAVAANAGPVASSSPSRIVDIPRDAATLPELFRRAGYDTFITGKWHNDTAALERSFARGRRVFIGGMSEHTQVPLRDRSPDGDYNTPPRFETGFSTELFCDAAIDFLSGRSGAEPFFLYLSLTSPHDPRTPPAPYAAAYPTEGMPLPANFLPAHPFDNGELFIRDELLAPKPLTPAVIQGQLSDYFGMVAHQDEQLGRVVAALGRGGLLADTIIVYVSDHGLALGSHGLLGKQNLYEPSVRVPLLISGPGIPSGRTCDRLVYSLDLYATLAALAGLPVPGGLESTPLPLLGGAGRDRVFAMYKDCQRMVCEGRWKLIRYRVGGRERLQLFDLENDPHELRDLAEAPAHQPACQRLLALLKAWQMSIGDRWLPLPAA
jgi:arylsulfatase A-like enzyme